MKAGGIIFLSLLANSVKKVRGSNQPSAQGSVVITYAWLRSAELLVS